MAENLSRVENDLSVLNDGTGTVVPPMSRVEVFLHKLLGEEMPNLIPQSRVEELLLELYDKEITGDIIPKEITEPGIYNATSEGKDGYNPVNVNITLPVLASKNITSNGTYYPASDNVDGYSSVVVDVNPTLMAKNITANGTYLASEDNVYGYSSAVVAIPLVTERSW